MGLIGNISTSLIGGIAVTSTTSSTIKEDGSIDTDSAKGLLTTTVSTSAATTAGHIANKHGMDEIRQQYTGSYIDSLSNEELEAMLVKLDLIEAEKFNDSTKTI